MDELPVVDRARLNAVARGDAAIAAEFLSGLAEESQAALDALERAVASGDAVQVRERAHSLRGMALEVGAPRVAASARALEGTSAPAGWPALLARLSEDVAALRAAAAG